MATATRDKAKPATRTRQPSHPCPTPSPANPSQQPSFPTEAKNWLRNYVNPHHAFVKRSTMLYLKHDGNAHMLQCAKAIAQNGTSSPAQGRSLVLLYSTKLNGNTKWSCILLKLQHPGPAENHARHCRTGCRHITFYSIAAQKWLK